MRMLPEGLAVTLSIFRNDSRDGHRDAIGTASFGRTGGTHLEVNVIYPSHPKSLFSFEVSNWSTVIMWKFSACKRSVDDYTMFEPHVPGRVACWIEIQERPQLDSVASTGLQCKVVSRWVAVDIVEVAQEDSLWRCLHESPSGRE